MTRLTLRFALPSRPAVVVYVVGENGCDEITGTGNGGCWLRHGRTHEYCAEWRIDEFQRTDPEPPSNKCKHCGETFTSPHALKVHAGMKHREMVA